MKSVKALSSRGGYAPLCRSMGALPPLTPCVRPWIKKHTCIYSIAGLPVKTTQNYQNLTIGLDFPFILNCFNNLCTGLPTKDETSETTVRNSYGLFLIFMVHGSMQQLKQYSFFAKSLNKPFNDYIQRRELSSTP